MFDEDLEMVSCIKDLGVIMDNNLQFTELIEPIVNKANKDLFVHGKKSCVTTSPKRLEIDIRQLGAGALSPPIWIYKLFSQPLTPPAHVLARQPVTARASLGTPPH